MWHLTGLTSDGQSAAAHLLDKQARRWVTLGHDDGLAEWYGRCNGPKAVKANELNQAISSTNNDEDDS